MVSNFQYPFLSRVFAFEMLRINLSSQNIGVKKFLNISLCGEFLKHCISRIMVSSGSGDVLGFFSSVISSTTRGNVQPGCANIPTDQTSYTGICGLPFANKAVHVHANTITLLGCARRKWNVK